MAVVIDGSNGISSPDYEVDGVTSDIPSGLRHCGDCIRYER
jgi:hypothetical protein